MTLSILRRAGGLFALLVLAAACDGPQRTPTQLSPAAGTRVKEVNLSDADGILMVRTPSAPAGERGGTTLDLDAGIFSKKGKVHPNKQERFYEWVSSDPSVATVDSTGLVTAVDIGNAFVIVDYKDMADTINIAVVPVPVKSVTISGADSISLDDTTTYTAATLDSVGEPLVGRSIAWSSSNAAALAIDTAGVAIALGEGTVIVTAESEGKSASVTTKIWPQPVSTIDVTPSTASVALYRGGVTFSATPRDRRGHVLTGRVVTWRSSSPETFTIDPATGVATTVAPGAGDAIAESQGKTGSARLTVTNPVEARALWINRFDYTDADSLRKVMATAAKSRFNIVYFQARASGDAFYKSEIEPCAVKICGKLGGSTPNATPSYDPLAIVVAEGEKYGIEVHAWLNAYTGWISGSASSCNLLIESTPRHMLKANPSWTMVDRSGVAMPCLSSPEYTWVSPGIPGVRAHLARVAADIARRYNVKGIHLDRIRYPGTAWSYDTASVNAYNRASNIAPGTIPSAFSTAWADFRRGLVNAGVREVRDSISAVRPSLVLSAAVWPIHRAMPNWGGTSKGYDDYFQDPRAWTAGGYLDVAAPMTYPASAASSSYIVKPKYCDFLDWECLFDDHRKVVEARDGRHMYIGVGAIKGWPEMDRQIAIARSKGATGISVYNPTTIRTNSPTAWTQLENGHFRYPATIPPMPWK